jgi:hypothetical protein
MRRFPHEFYELLSESEWQRLNRKIVLGRGPGSGSNPLVWVANPVAETTTAGCLQLLERRLGPLLRPLDVRIPREKTSQVRENYAEHLPKVASFSAAYLSHSRSRAATEARRLGLLAMMRSHSLQAVAESATGLALEPDPGCQVIRYGPADYIGPHNDDHPQQSHLRDGYVDVHLSFAAPGVKHQMLVHEEDGHLRKVVDASSPSGISINCLPFWHHVTPLVPRKGAERSAFRWLLLTSFVITDNVITDKGL